MTRAEASTNWPAIQRGRRRWLQFRLRTLLLLLTILAVGPGSWVVYEQRQARRQQLAVQTLKQTLGGEFYVRPRHLWTWIAPDAPGDVVGLGFRYSRKVSDDNLAPIANFPALVWLDIQQTPLADDGLVHLSGLSNLQRLRLDETHVTDAGLVHLSGLKELRMLNLHKTQVTDEGLVHLAGLENLETLNLQRTQVTDAGVARLQEALPNVQVMR